MRLLIVEDTEDLAEAIASRLRKLGHAVDLVGTGEEADELLRTETYHLVVLDLMLPGMGGKEVLQRLRQRRAITPVLVLTARSDVDDKVGVLDFGADDYLVKPFDFRELEARCRVLLRRPHGMAASEVRFGDLVFDGAAKRVTINGNAVELGAREFRLLELLLANLNRVLSKDAMLDQLFGLDDAVAPNAVELYVSRLRRKLEGSAVRVRTIRGLGYVAEVETTH
jgi:two-component system response regulator TctD